MMVEKQEPGIRSSRGTMPMDPQASAEKGLQESIFQLLLIPPGTSDLASACISPLKQLIFKITKI